MNTLNDKCYQCHEECSHECQECHKNFCKNCLTIVGNDTFQDSSIYFKYKCWGCFGLWWPIKYKQDEDSGWINGNVTQFTVM